MKYSEYKRAKDKTLVWMIIGFILGGIIIGIIMLVAYLKYDELLRHTQLQTSTVTPT